MGCVCFEQAYTGIILGDRLFDLVTQKCNDQKIGEEDINFTKVSCFFNVYQFT